MRISDWSSDVCSSDLTYSRDGSSRANGCQPSWEFSSMSDKNFNGGCQCGAVRYQAKGEPIMAAICHCSMCRRANAAPVVAWAMFEDSQVNFTSSRPRNFDSSQGAERGFCGPCGT